MGPRDRDQPHGHRVALPRSPAVLPASELPPGPADSLDATRNVPVASAPVDYGLPAHREEHLPATEFVHPDLESMRAPTIALLIGRALMVAAAVLVAVAAARSSGPARAQRGEAFWPVAWSSAVFVAVGLAGLVVWSAMLAHNARRLGTRSASARWMAVTWALPALWVVVSAVTYLRVEVGGELDPLPGVAGVGFAILLAVPYARLQGVFRALSRRPPSVWATAFLLDLVAFGPVWWRLTSWPDPVTSGDADHVRRTAMIALAASGVLAVNLLVFVRLGRRGEAALFERSARLEARYRQNEQQQREQQHQQALQAEQQRRAQRQQLEQQRQAERAARQRQPGMQPAPAAPPQNRTRRAPDGERAPHQR